MATLAALPRRGSVPRAATKKRPSRGNGCRLCRPAAGVERRAPPDRWWNLNPPPSSNPQPDVPSSHAQTTPPQLPLAHLPPLSPPNRRRRSAAATVRAGRAGGDEDRVTGRCSLFAAPGGPRRPDRRRRHEVDDEVAPPFESLRLGSSHDRGGGLVDQLGRPVSSSSTRRGRRSPTPDDVGPGPHRRCSSGVGRTRSRTALSLGGASGMAPVAVLGGHPNPAISGQLKTGHFR